MSREGDVVLVITSAPDRVVARTIAHTLIEKKLAACVNLGAPVLSIYEWNDTIESTDEIPLWIKTTVGKQDVVMQALATLHPYDVPEILVVPVIAGSAAYLQWVREQTNGTLPSV